MRKKEKEGAYIFEASSQWSRDYFSVEQGADGPKERPEEEWR